MSEKCAIYSSKLYNASPNTANLFALAQKYTFQEKSCKGCLKIYEFKGAVHGMYFIHYIYFSFQNGNKWNFLENQAK